MRNDRGWDVALEAQNRMREIGCLAGVEKGGARRVRAERAIAPGPLRMWRWGEGDRWDLVRTAAHAAMLGDPMWVSRDVCRLVTAAAESFDSEALFPDDVFAPYVFAYLEESPEWEFGPIVSWARAEFDHNPGDTGLALAWWETAQADFRLVFTGSVTFGSDAMSIDDSKMREGFRWLQVLWRLAAQEVVIAGRQQVSRPVWRRKNNWREIKTVQVLTLRRASRGPHLEVPPPHGVEWSHRWAVRGHWRNQWYPKLQRHCQIWIEPHIKGPEDKPYVDKGRGIEFVR